MVAGLGDEGGPSEQPLHGADDNIRGCAGAMIRMAFRSADYFWRRRATICRWFYEAFNWVHGR